MTTKPRILLFDIENAPGLAYIWQLKNDYIDPRMIKEEWFMLCWAAKWLGEKRIISSALIDHKGYNPKKPCDKAILAELWKLLDEADLAIAHNGRAFDCKKANARFVKHGMTPPSPYRIIDTLSEARKHFLFISNRLNEVARILGVGSKIRTGGFDLWEDCLSGCPKAWKKMKRYCKHDVLLLERVYLKLRPYIKNHPNTSIYSEELVCGRCDSYDLELRGYVYTNAGKKQKFKCMDCGGWGRVLMKKTSTEARNV